MCSKGKSCYQFKVPSDAGDLDNKDVKGKDIWTGFKEQTTAHGIPHVDQARGECDVKNYLLVRAHKKKNPRL